MSEALVQDPVKVLNVNLETDYSKNVCALVSTLVFAVIFYYVHVLCENLFQKSNERLSVICYQKYNTKTPTTDSKSELKKIEHSLWMIKNLQISFIHSTSCSLFILYTVFKNPEMFDDLILHTSTESYLLVAFSAGYFVYDFFDMYQSKKLIEMWIVSVHHCIVISLFSYHILNVYCLGYSLIALCMEFNSVFLHSRKLLKLYGIKKTDLIYKINSFFNFVTFILFRFGVLLYILIDIYLYNHRITRNYLTLLLSCFTSMTIMNIGLFLRLVVKDFRPKKEEAIKQD